MILEIVTAAIAGACLVGKIATRKKAPKLLLASNVYAHQSIKNFQCPKCGTPWHYKSSAPIYCECEEFYEGHFHMKCEGIAGKKAGVGCQYKWMMVTKDFKK